MFPIWSTPRIPRLRTMNTSSYAVKTFSRSLSILKTEEPRKAKKKKKSLAAILASPTNKENKN